MKFGLAIRSTPSRNLLWTLRPVETAALLAVLLSGCGSETSDLPIQPAATSLPSPVSPTETAPTPASAATTTPPPIRCVPTATSSLPAPLSCSAWSGARTSRPLAASKASSREYREDRPRAPLTYPPTPGHSSLTDCRARPLIIYSRYISVRLPKRPG